MLRPWSYRSIASSTVAIAKTTPSTTTKKYQRPSSFATISQAVHAPSGCVKSRYNARTMSVVPEAAVQKWTKRKAMNERWFW